LSNSDRTPRLIPVGKIVRPHGVRGAVKVYPYGESLEVQEAGAKVFLQPDSKAKQPELTIAGLSPQQKMLVVKFAELNSKDEALVVAGAEVFLPEDRLPPPSEGEYYHFQLIGLAVETLQGKEIGTLCRILETGDADVYSIDFKGREILIPAVEGVIVEVDLERGRMVVDPPEGLVDDL
jgi:16S rRNA processing protein RimM